MKIDYILNRFPKIRPRLSQNLKKIYADEYKKNRDGRTPLTYVAQKLESWMHKKAAQSSPLKHLSSYDTLEIGAGTLNQLKFETLNGNYDFIEPFTMLYKNNPLLSLLRNGYKDISEIDLSIKYNRIISIAVLEHLDNLPEVLAKSIRHMAEDAVFACGIPSVGGFLWGLAWRVTTGLEFRIRTGLNYSELQKHEHLNEAWEIESVLKYFFIDVKVKRLGFGKHFSLYTYIECRNPKSMET